MTDQFDGPSVPDTSQPPSGAKSRVSIDRRFLAAGAGVLAILVLSAFVFVAHPWMSSSTSTQAYTINGTFSLYGHANFGSYDTGGCFTDNSSGYGDITEGANVTVKNGGGTIVATGALKAGTYSTPGGSDVCTFAFAVSVPKEDFYDLTVSHRGDQNYSFSDMQQRGWNVALTLGT
jgi:hypothetical protein